MALKRRQKISPNFSMASMTDIIFLLLIFFMITSTMVSPNAIKVLLPQGRQQTSAKPLTRVIIDKNLNFYTAFGNEDEMPIDLEELPAFLQRCAEKEPDMYVALYADDEFDKLIDQARMLFDQDLADNNSKDDYKKSVETSIADYKNRSFKIRQTNVCDSDDVKYLTDDSNGDKLAYVTASYFTEENKKFDKTYQMYVLRKDDNGDWKIRTFYKIKGNSTEEE
jgi:biopolymer transport protein ExbD